MVAKTNVLTFAHDLWMRAFNEVAPRLSRHQDATISTWTPAACGWSSAPSGST